MLTLVAGEVKFHGLDDKRQFTVTPIIDGEGSLVQPTQMIWGGQEFVTTKDPSDPTGKK